MTQSWEQHSAAGGRYRLYRLIGCDECRAKGKIDGKRCVFCRGEGRVRDLVANCETPEAVGVALVTLGREGEFQDVPFGLLDTEGETGKKWLVLPWTPSARNVRDAARVLRSARKTTA